MFNIKLAILSIVFMCCNQQEGQLNISFDDYAYTSDTAFIDNNILIMNEYYPMSIENNLYDTVFLVLSHLNNSKVKSILTSQVFYYKAGSIIASDLINNGHMADDSIIAISKHQTEIINFLLPEFSDTLTQKSYDFFIYCDSSGIKINHYLRIFPTHGSTKCLVEIH